MRRKLVMGNWKMNSSKHMAKVLITGLVDSLKDLKEVDVAVCPPFVYLDQVHEMLVDSAIGLGAQDVSLHEKGAFSGEISAEMLKDIACDFVIVGHSERRQYHTETNEMVAEKFQQVLKNGMTPVLCIGETLEQREAAEVEFVLSQQVQAVLKICSAKEFAGAVIAYEPVWAIGTGVTATPEQVQEVHAFLREMLAGWDPDTATNTRLLYGGSVKPANAMDLFSLKDVDGGLIGGAALKVDDFTAICRA